MKKIFKLFVPALCFTGILTGCGGNELDAKDFEKKEVATCAPTNNSSIEHTEYILLTNKNSDKKVIEKFTFSQEINKDYINAKLKEKQSHGEKITFDELYNTYRKTLINNYKAANEENKSLPWINANYSENPKEYKAKFTISFDFANKTFAIDTNTMDFLSHYMYNHDLFDEKSSLMVYNQSDIEAFYKEDGADISCSSELKTFDQTLYKRLKDKVQDIEFQAQKNDEN